MLRSKQDQVLVPLQCVFVSQELEIDKVATLGIDFRKNAVRSYSQALPRNFRGLRRRGNSFRKLLADLRSGRLQARGGNTGGPRGGGARPGGFPPLPLLP